MRVPLTSRSRLGGAIAEAGINSFIFRNQSKEKRISFLEGYSSVGLSVSTGAEFGVAGICVSVLGLGFSVGRKTGFSIPFREFSLNF